MGYARRLAHVEPNFNSVASMRTMTKSAEADHVGRGGSRIFCGARFRDCAMGAAGRRWWRFRSICSREEFPGPAGLRACRFRRAMGRMSRMCGERRPRWSTAKQSGDLRGAGNSLGAGVAAAARLAELLGAPVCTSLQGKSSFPRRSSAGARLGRAGVSAHRFRIFSGRPIGFSASGAASRRLRSASPCRTERSSFTRRSIRTI